MVMELFLLSLFTGLCLTECKPSECCGVKGGITICERFTFFFKRLFVLGLRVYFPYTTSDSYAVIFVYVWHALLCKNSFCKSISVPVMMVKLFHHEYLLYWVYLLNVGRDGDSVKVDRQTEILIVGRFTVGGILEQSTAVNTRGASPKPV